MAEDSVHKRLARQASHYSVSSLFSLIAGMITFPLLTRIFSIEDYGVMNLVAATLTVAVAVGKVGVQHSILRYQSEIAAGKSRFTLKQLYATTFFGMVGSALFVMAGLLLVTGLVPAHRFNDPRLRGLLAIASLLIVVQVVESAVTNVLRAEQRTTTLMKYQVAKKYFGIALIVFAVLVISRSLTAFYTASVIGETVALLFLTFSLFRAGDRPRPTLNGFSRPLYRELIAFGIPMMIGYELSGIILSVGDRYVIEWLVGEKPLGLYAAAYNLCQYVQAVVIASIGQAIMPIYMQMWDQKGPDETGAFISRSLRNYVLFGAPIIAGLASVGPELLPSLASEKYASAAVILPWVIAGMVVDGTTAMLGAGLFIHRKTRIIMIIVLSCAILNLGLNVILVPRLGIVGAAIATLISYAAAAMALGAAGRKFLPVAIPWSTLLRASAAAIIMYAALYYICPGRRLLTIGVRLSIGVPVYAAVIALIDEDARAFMQNGLNWLRTKLGMSSP